VEVGNGAQTDRKCQLIKIFYILVIVHKSDTHFQDLHLTVNTVNSELHHKSLGVNKSTSVTSIEMGNGC
jgi:hypothetical protein